MPDIEFEGISHKWQIVLAFFLGGAISSLAQDPSDTIYFWASSQGLLSNSTYATIFWYWVPFALYLSLFAFGYILARYTKVRASFLLYFYAFLVIISTFLSLTLKQNTDNIYVASVFLGTIVSLGVIYGLRREINGS
jgi:hypothetical protein